MKSIVNPIILVYFCSANVAGWGWGCDYWCSSPDGQYPSKHLKKPDTIKLDLNRSNVIKIKWVSKNSNHKWFLSYKYENVRLSTNIGNITFNYERNVKKKYTQFTLTVEAFDNDAEIYCDTDEDLKSIWRLQFVGKNMKELEILKYNENHNVSSEYLKPCYESSHDVFSFTSYTSGPNGWITRYVKKKTLLLYDVTDQQDSLEDTEKRKKGITSESTTEHAKGTDAGTSNDDANLDSQHAKPGNQIVDSSKTLVIYIVSAVAGALMLLIIVIIIKRRKNPKSRVEEPRVLNAELDLLRQHESGSLPKEGPEEESTYAEIIGEIRPQ